MQCGPNDDVCNGPLSADTDYGVRYRLIAENGLSQDYDFSDAAIFTTGNFEMRTCYAIKILVLFCLHTDILSYVTTF